MISMDKQYRTRKGENVRLLCVDGPGVWPVIGLVGQNLFKWSGAGRYLDEKVVGTYDLVEVKPPVVKWVNVYKDFLGGTYDNKDCAGPAAAGRGRTGVLKITYIEGQDPTFEYIKD